jgi:Kef-type K+ transport system membrane component KefB
LNSEILITFFVIVILQSLLFSRFRISGLLSGAIFGIIFGELSLNLISYTSEMDILMEIAIFFVIFGLSLVIPSGEFFKKYVWTHKSLAVIPTLLTAFVVFIVSMSLDFALHISMILVLIFVTVSTSLNSVATNYFRVQNLEKSHISKLFFVGAVPNNLFSLSIFMILLSIFDSGDVSLTGIILPILELVLFIFIAIVLSRYFYPLAFFKPLDILDRKLHRKKDNRFTHNTNLVILLLLINALILGFIGTLFGFHAFFGAYLSTIFIPEKFLIAPLKEKVSSRINYINGLIFMPILGLILSQNIDAGILFDYELFIPFVVLTVSIIGVQFLSNLILSRINTLTVFESLVVSVGSIAKAELALIMLFIFVSYGLIDPEIFTSSVILIVILNLISWIGFEKIKQSNLTE